MKLLRLVNTKICAQVDDEDFDLCARHTWYLAKRRDTYYAVTVLDSNSVFVHQLILPSGNPNMTPDHINGDGLDNRKINLRLATKSQQQANRGKQKTKYTISSKYKGVSWAKGNQKWLARVNVNYKQICLGHYKDEVDAARAYNRAAKQYFGEFAKLNIIEGAKPDGLLN